MKKKFLEILGKKARFVYGTSSFKLKASSFRFIGLGFNPIHYRNLCTCVFFILLSRFAGTLFSMLSCLYACSSTCVLPSSRLLVAILLFSLICNS